MMSIRNWSGKTEKSCITFCVWSRVCALTLSLITSFSHSPITLAWTSLWHRGKISRHALTTSAPSPVCCCCVGRLCLCLRKNKKRLGDGRFPLFFFERVCLCSLFSDTSSVRADLVLTSHPHPAVTSPLLTAAAKSLYKQLNVRVATWMKL